MPAYKKRLHEAMNRGFAPFRDAPPRQVEAAGARVLEQLRRHSEWESSLSTPLHTPATRHPRFYWPAVAVISVAVSLAVLISATVLQSSAAILEDSSGSRSVRYGELIQSSRTNGSTLRVSNGSAVEVRSESELSLERAQDVIHLRLRRGDVIVNNLDTGAVPLQVETTEMSAAGKVFLVSANPEGSRVGVIGGEARVVQGATEKKLYPGDQVATAPMKEAVTVSTGISWSREAVTHLAALQEGTATPIELRKEFEVAAIHLNGSGTTSSRLEHRNERVTISNATPESIIRYAFNYKMRISGPAALTAKRYDVVAKAPSGTSDSDLLFMLQSLLVDRFKMKFHRETIDMPIYALIVGKNGHKLSEVKPGETVSGFGSGSAGMPGWSYKTTIGDMQRLAASLSRDLDRPVVDQTGLSGRFSVVLSFVSEDRLADVPGPSIFTAVQEQLGLKLEAQRGPVEILVIDQLQDPTPD